MCDLLCYVTILVFLRYCILMTSSIVVINVRSLSYFQIYCFFYLPRRVVVSVTASGTIAMGFGYDFREG